MSESAAPRSLGGYTLEHLMIVTVGFVAATILLGVATKATGGGLACNANWPLCDGGIFNLFPETVPSFFEWFHRVVAMIAGLLIAGTAVAAWWSDRFGRRITALLVAGAVLTPVQVVLGRQTVLTYEMTILSLHFWTAIVIFTLFLGATVLVWRDRLSLRHVTGALLIGTVAVPTHVLLSPVLIAHYTPVLQTLQYGVTLLLISGLTVVLVVLSHERSVPLAASTSGMLLVALMILGRQSVMSVTGGFETLYLLSAAGLFVALIATVITNRREHSRTRPVQG